MDPDDQQSKKITLANFFESIKDTNVVAQRALKLSSGLGKTIEKTTETVEVNKKDILELQKTVETISKDVNNITDYIQEQQERRSRELDKREDEIFEKEDKLQKESKIDESQKQSSGGGGGDSLSAAGAALSGGLGVGLMGLNAFTAGRGFGGIIGGSIDALTGNVTDFDRRGGKGGALAGMIDFFTLNAFDLDEKGGLFTSREEEERRKRLRDKKTKKLDQFYDKKFFGGEIMGPTGIDQVPILATSGETIISKKDTEEIKERGFSIDGMLKFIRNMLGIDKEKKKNDNPYKVKDTNSKDFSILAAVSALESADPQGQADVAQSIYNRLGDVVADIEGVPGAQAINDYTKQDFTNTGSGFPEPTISDIVLKDAQYQPTYEDPYASVGPGTKVADIWKNITDNETAIDAMVSYYKKKKDPRPDKEIRIDATRNFYNAVKSLQNKKLVESAQEFVGGRTEFRGGQPLDEQMVSGTGVDRGEIRGSSNDQHNMFFVGKQKQLDGSFETLGTNQQLKRGFQLNPLLESKSSNTSDLQSIVPSLEDSNQNYSVDLAQNPLSSDGAVEIMEAINIDSGGVTSDGTGSTIPSQFDVASTGSPVLIDPECPFDICDLKRDKSNKAFV